MEGVEIINLKRPSLLLSIPILIKKSFFFCRTDKNAYFCEDFIKKLKIMKLNLYQLDAIRQLCPKFYVKYLYAFGSVIGESFNEGSDVDLLVTFMGVPMLDFADNYFDFQASLEKIVARKVDLVIEKSLTNPVLIRSIHKSKQTIYAAA